MASMWIMVTPTAIDALRTVPKGLEKGLENWWMDKDHPDYNIV